MPRKNHTAPVAYFHPDDPVGWLKPDEPFTVDGFDVASLFVVYRDVKGFDGYRVGTNGTVWSKLIRHSGEIGEEWHLLAPGLTGYHQTVNLYRGHKRHCRSVHRLVLEAFLGARPEGMMGRHFNDNPGNNNLWNLGYGTRQDNADDMVRNGGSASGEKNHTAKLTEDLVIEIRVAYAVGEATQTELAKRHGVVQSIIGRIVTGQSWTHVGGPITKRGRVGRPRLRIKGAA